MMPYLPKAAASALALVAIAVASASDAAAQVNSRAFRPSTFSPFTVKATVKPDFGTNPFVVFSRAVNPFTANPTTASTDLPGVGVTNATEVTTSASVSASSTPVVVEAVTGTRPYRPPVRSPYRPAPRPPFTP